jgi:hypothetical protein
MVLAESQKLNIKVPKSDIDKIADAILSKTPLENKEYAFISKSISIQLKSFKTKKHIDIEENLITEV